MSNIIFVVEDEEIIYNLIADPLASYGYEPRWFQTTNEAFEFITTQAVPDLILLDYFLDGSSLSCKEFCGIIYDRYQTPIIILSGLIEPPDISSLLGNCAADFINKPFSIIDLARRIKGILG